MTEQHINLETAETYLASVVLPQGNILPSPIIVLPDETPLYDDAGTIKEMGLALDEERPAMITGEIVKMERYNSTLLTVTFKSDKLDNAYRVNIPRQFVQVGYMYDRLLHTPVCGLITESEIQLAKDFNFKKNIEEKKELLPPFMSDDLMFYLSFPKELSEEVKTDYNQLLYSLDIDLIKDISKEEIREIAPMVRVVMEAEESRSIRIDVIKMLTGLVEGDEDSLVQLYELGEYVDSAKAAMTKNAILSEDERKAVIIAEYIARIASFLSPSNLTANLKDIERSANPDKEEEDTDKDSVEGMEDLFGEGFTSSLNDIVSEFRQENRDTVTITADSSHEERLEYLSLPSNTIPLMGGLKKLSDALNLDLYYSQDWNRDTVTEDDYGTNGEYIILLAVLALQRVQMFGKCLDIPEEVQAVKTLTLSLTSDALTQSGELEEWYLREALERAGKGDLVILEQVLILAMSDFSKDEQVIGPVGNIMHWLAHMMTDEEDFSQEEMTKAFAGLPAILEFVGTLYSDYEDYEEEETDEDEDGDEEECFATESCVNLPFAEGKPNIELASTIAKALVIYAEQSLLKYEPELEKGTPEWEKAMGEHLCRVLHDE